MQAKHPITIEPAEHTLMCPHCNSNNLHHRKVTVKERENEDGPGFATEVSGVADVSIKPVGTDAFVGRRGHLEIGFWCEICDEEPVLIIKQHKGITQVYWNNPNGQ